MKINNNEEIVAAEVKMEGANDVKMKILIGPDDESENIIMRYFIIAPGGNTKLKGTKELPLMKMEMNMRLKRARVFL